LKRRSFRFETLQAADAGKDLRNDSKIDVIMLTKNSERVLRRCLGSIYENLPVGNLIVVDGNSTDSTLRILQEFHERYGNLVVLQDEGTRASARQKAIGYVKSDWFMFVDSDVVLCEGWFAKARKLMSDDVGAIWGIEVWSILVGAKFLNLFERLTMKIFDGRGGTHDLLVRTKAVEDIAIPYYLHTYEDSYIRSWIIKKGYKVIAVYDPYCLHYRSEDVWTTKKSIALIAGDLKFATRHPQLMLSYAFYAVIVLYQSALTNLRIEGRPRV
jgi:glycosyltransferase involved in cell wall biosynthesis